MATSSHLRLLFLIATVSFLTSASSPRSLPPQDHLHADSIIQAMIGAGDFRDWAADFLFAVDDRFGIPLPSTIFIPTGFDAADVSSSNGGADSGRVSVAYHVVPHRLSFTDLRLLRPLSRLPTLLPGNSIVVTNNSVFGFTLDGVLVSEPDLFVSSSIAIHGVALPLDFSRYGDFGNGDAALADSLFPWPHHLRPESNINQTSASVSIRTFLNMLVLVSIGSGVVLTLHSGDFFRRVNRSRFH